MQLKDFAIKCDDNRHARIIKQWLYNKGHSVYAYNITPQGGYRHLVYHHGSWAVCGDSWTGLRDLIIVTPEDIGL